MKLKACKSCFVPNAQIKLEGSSLIRKTDVEVHNIVLALNPIGLQHVCKHTASGVAYLHFSNNQTSSNFFSKYPDSTLQIDNNTYTMFPPKDRFGNVCLLLPSSPPSPPRPKARASSPPSRPKATVSSPFLPFLRLH
ncbi:hypothetical protein INT48_003789 [Thamnidium elegans]|uniref:Uncharacterized protein n=1 Tax=Thamnidium elegans TaxID=101142 RepID=A0A8H7STS7_9FUNG|nr:hypothetical protein INT48_003789 [Thamnidium elegans]